MRLPFRVFWFLLAVFAIVDGIGALRYLLPHVPAAAPLDNFIRHRVALSLHAFCGGIALLAGPLQFLPAFRTYHWRTHRVLGRIYFAGVLIGGIASLNLARHAQTGLPASWRSALCGSPRRLLPSVLSCAANKTRIAGG